MEQQQYNPSYLRYGSLHGPPAAVLFPMLPKFLSNLEAITEKSD